MRLALGLALLLVGGAGPAWGQVTAGVDTLRLAVAAGGTAEAVLRLTNEGAAEAALALRLGPLTPPTVRPGTVLALAEAENPFSITAASDGRVFTAEVRSGAARETQVFSADLEFLYEFHHPTLNFYSSTVGLAADPARGTLWWLDSYTNPDCICHEARAIRVIEADTLGHVTGRRVSFPIGPGVPGQQPPVETSAAVGLGYDDEAGVLFSFDPVHYEVWAVDTAGAVAAGYPARYEAYSPPTFSWSGYGNYGLSLTGPFLETAVALSSGGELQARRAVVMGRDGRDWGAETPIPSFAHLGMFPAVYGVARSRVAPDSVLYLAVSTDETDAVVALRAAPLPPPWLRPDTVRTRLPAGEIWDVRLTVDARDLAPGTYTAAVRAVRTAGALQQTALDTVVTVPVVLEVGLVADEPGPRQAVGFALGAPYPNPTSGAVTVPLALPEPAAVRVEAFDVLGRAVAAVEAELAPGRHALRLDVGHLAAGAYVVRATAGGESATARLTVVR